MRRHSSSLLLIAMVLAACSTTPVVVVTPMPSPSAAPSATPSAASSLSPLEPIPSPAGSPVATSAPGFSGGDALGGGRLGAARAGRMTCFFVTNVGSRAKTALVWPSGFSAGIHGSVLGPDNQVLARARDQVTLGGGSPPPGFEPSVKQDPCGFGSIFWVSSVVSVNGRPVNIGEGSLRLTHRASDGPSTCPTTALEPLMLVMVDEHLMLRVVSSGIDLDASWPAAYSTRTDPIRVVDGAGRTVAKQGREVNNLRGTLGSQITVCGVG